MEKKKVDFKKIVAKAKRKAKRVLLVIASVALVLVAIRVFLYNDTPSVDTTAMYSSLTAASELTTAKFTYTGKTDYTDTGIPVISKANFIIVYKATARIGIDLKDVKIDADEAEKIILVTVPAATVQEVKVDPATIEFFDHKFALFNLDEKEDAVVAQALAEGDAKKEAEALGVLEFANQQAKELIKGLLSECMPAEYTIQFVE